MWARGSLGGPYRGPDYHTPASGSKLTYANVNHNAPPASLCPQRLCKCAAAAHRARLADTSGIIVWQRSTWFVFRSFAKAQQATRTCHLQWTRLLSIWDDLVPRAGPLPCGLDAAIRPAYFGPSAALPSCPACTSHWLVSTYSSLFALYDTVKPIG